MTSLMRTMTTAQGGDRLSVGPSPVRGYVTVAVPVEVDVTPDECRRFAVLMIEAAAATERRTGDRR